MKQETLSNPLLERQLLAGLSLDHDAYFDILDIVSAEDFTDPDFQMIFRLMGDVYRGNSSEHPDIFSLLEAWKTQKSGDAERYLSVLIEIQSAATTSTMIKEHAQWIKDLSMKRNTRQHCQDIVEQIDSGEGDALEILQDAETKLTGVRDQCVEDKITMLDPPLQAAFDEAMDAADGKAPPMGAPSGFPALDRITHGFAKGEVTIVAGRPGQGKTAWLANVISNMLNHPDGPIPVLVYTMEMEAKKIANRMLFAEAQVPLGIVHEPQRFTLAEKTALQAAKKKLTGLPCVIDATPAMDINELHVRAKRAKHKHDIGAICIDYLQLMKDRTLKSRSKTEEVESISNQLKQIAMELEVPVIVLSQLNRNIENREPDSRRPQLSDLKASGAIEQDADVVMFIHRPEAMGTNVGNSNIPASSKEITDLIVAKNRNGAVGEVRMRFREQFTRFYDLGVPMEASPSAESMQRAPEKKVKTLDFDQLETN